MTTRPKLSETREERDRRRTPQEALADLRRLQTQILAENGGAPIDVDAILAEMRGYTD